MTEHDFLRIAKALHRAAGMENGRVEMHFGFQQLAEEIADACERDPRFDRVRFMNACELPKLPEHLE